MHFVWPECLRVLEEALRARVCGSGQGSGGSAPPLQAACMRSRARSPHTSMPGTSPRAELLRVVQSIEQPKP